MVAVASPSCHLSDSDSRLQQQAAMVATSASFGKARDEEECSVLGISPENNPQDKNTDYTNNTVLCEVC